jgi:hypothetical protein
MRAANPALVLAAVTLAATTAGSATGAGNEHGLEGFHVGSVRRTDVLAFVTARAKRR